MDAGKKHLEQITEKIIQAAEEVHKILGPEMLESAYQKALAYELGIRQLEYREQIAVPFTYKGVQLDCALNLDILVENQVIVELKAIDTLTPIHEVQAIPYLRMTGKKICLIINFHTRLLRDGIKRIKLNS